MLVIALIQQIIFQNNKYSSGSFTPSRHCDQHMSSWVNHRFFLPDDRIHAKIHLVIDYTLPHSSHVHHTFLILHLPVIHLQTHEHRILTAGIQPHHVHTNTVRFMRLPRRMHYQSLLLALHHIHEFLFLDGCHHYGPASRVHRQILPYLNNMLPGTILRQPDFPKVY